MSNESNVTGENAERPECTLLVLDNNDSFTFNLVQMFRLYPLRIEVVRADRITLREVKAKCPDYILVSPGPRAPSSAGVSVEVVRRLHRLQPILGVCLGMQCINEAFGGATVRAPEPMHGKTSLVHHCQRGIFAGVPNPMLAARYHSLAVANVSDELETTAHTLDGVSMGLSHREFPLHGVQFHPESFLTSHGELLIRNFLQQGILRRTIA